MARYDPGRQDPYVDPATGVLRNRLGAEDQDTLDRLEASVTALAAFELAARPEPGTYDLGHLQRVHRRLFGDVYDWAGTLRTVDVSKGGTRFAHHGVLAAAAADVFGALAREQHLRGLPPDRFAERAAYHLGEVNVLHPFREGNGRAQRALFGQLAREAGYQIRWDAMSRDAMTHASIAAYDGDPGPLARLVGENLVAAPVAAAVPNQTYRGPVTAVTPTTVTQLVDGVRLMEHERAKLYGQTGALAAGRAVVIAYTGGLGKVADPHQQTRRRGR